MVHSVEQTFPPFVKNLAYLQESTPAVPSAHGYGTISMGGPRPLPVQDAFQQISRARIVLCVCVAVYVHGSGSFGMPQPVFYRLYIHAGCNEQ